MLFGTKYDIKGKVLLVGGRTANFTANIEARFCNIDEIKEYIKKRLEFDMDDKIVDFLSFRIFE
jgi:hypothetical protein